MSKVNGHASSQMDRSTLCGASKDARLNKDSTYNNNNNLNAGAADTDRGRGRDGIAP